MNLHIKIRGPDLEVNLNIAPLFWERLARERVLDYRVGPTHYDLSYPGTHPLTIQTRICGSFYSIWGDHQLG